MAKQATKTINRDNVNARFDLFSVLPASVQSLISEADEKQIILDLSRVEPFPALKEWDIGADEFPFQSLADIVENIGSERFYNASVVAPLDAKIQSRKDARAKVERDIIEKYSRWLNREKYPALTIRNYACKRQGGDIARYAFLDFGETQDAWVASPKYGNAVLMKDGESKRFERTAKLSPEATASLVHWLLDAIAETCDYLGIKDADKRRLAGHENSQVRILLQALANVESKKRTQSATADDRDNAA